jgi:2-phosphosulfolactate phosphatase
MFDDRSAFRERFERGAAGIRRLAPISDIEVVVDVLGFATAVDIAVGRGATVFPYPRRGDAAVAYARERGAIAAADRQGGDGNPPYSLAPTSLMPVPPGTRLVLPSPNGATLVLLAAEFGTTVFAGCLRNAAATTAAYRALGGSVAVIAAGERWRANGDATGSLRPAIEDLVGAGTILHALTPTHPSPEAMATVAAFRAVTDLGRFLLDCASGNELATQGFAADVALAAQIDANLNVLRLVAGAFAPEQRESTACAFIVGRVAFVRIDNRITADPGNFAPWLPLSPATGTPLSRRRSRH